MVRLAYTVLVLSLPAALLAVEVAVPVATAKDAPIIRSEGRKPSEEHHAERVVITVASDGHVAGSRLPDVQDSAIGEVLLEAPPTTKEPDLLRLVEGVGAMTYDLPPSNSRRINRTLRERLVAQDIATLAVLLGAFILTLAASLMSIYQVSPDPSPVLFYCDPKDFRQRLICSSAEPEAFLQAFNTQPQTARLRLIGRRSEGTEESQTSNRWRRFQHACETAQRFVQQNVIGSRRGQLPEIPPDAVLFDVCLDLTPFIASDGRLASEEDSIKLAKHLASTNPLEVLLLQKKVEWGCWEEVSANIKQRLGTLGFAGNVEVTLEAQEELLIYRNHPWQNFVRNRIAQALVFLSMVGCFVWTPYMWMRAKTVRIESRFQINLEMARYWELLASGLSATQGFQGEQVVLR